MLVSRGARQTQGGSDHLLLGRKAITRMVNGEDWHATGQFTAGTPSSPRVPIGQ